MDYKLAPEAVFPTALEQNYATLAWLHQNAGHLGVDAARIAISGDSAGGGHAAALAIAARDRKEFPIAFQCLIYPMLDDRTGSTHRVPPHIGHFVWTEAANRFGWSSLLGIPAGSSSVPPGSVPARVKDLSGLPPTFIGVGSIDLFCEEDMEYAKRLALSGVRAELFVVPGAWSAACAGASTTYCICNLSTSVVAPPLFVGLPLVWPLDMHALRRLVPRVNVFEGLTGFGSSMRR